MAFGARRSLSDTFAGIAPSSAPAFIAAQLAGTLAAVSLMGGMGGMGGMGWLMRTERQTPG
jgi:membrane protein DedA with SNARE-associated domain